MRALCPIGTCPRSATTPSVTGDGRLAIKVGYQVEPEAQTPSHHQSHGPATSSGPPLTAISASLSAARLKGIRNPLPTPLPPPPPPSSPQPLSPHPHHSTPSSVSAPPCRHLPCRPRMPPCGAVARDAGVCASFPPGRRRSRRKTLGRCVVRANGVCWAGATGRAGLSGAGVQAGGAGHYLPSMSLIMRLIVGLIVPNCTIRAGS